jgi:transposase
MFRIYPKKEQEARLHSTIHLCSEAYNMQLKVHEAAYERSGISLSRNDLNNRIVELKRQDTRFKSVYRQLLQNHSDRLSKAFVNFLRRCKRNKEGKNIRVGYPSYKKIVHSITYPQNNGSFNAVTLGRETRSSV